MLLKSYFSLGTNMDSQIPFFKKPFYHEFKTEVSGFSCDYKINVSTLILLSAPDLVR